MIGIAQIAVITALIAVCCRISIRRDRFDRPPGTFFDLWRCMGRMGRSPAVIIVLLLSIAVTVAFVVGGWDYAIQRWLQRVDPLGRQITWPAFMVGNVWTLVSGLLLFWLAKRRDDFVRIAGAAASLQAIIITFYVVTVLKVLSGRRGPDWLEESRSKSGHFKWTKDAADFDFAFWNHAQSDGRFFWPSGHTATAVAFVSALVAFHPHVRWIPWVGYPLAAFMGWCMIDGDHHWVSDVLAGAAIAHVIGWQVGKAMRKEAERRTSQPPTG